MDRYLYSRPPRWWAPHPSRIGVRIWSPIRRYQQRHGHRVREIDVQNLDHVEDAVDQGHGVLIASNHVSHADCYLVLEALLRLPYRSYYMIAWQVFQLMQRWQRFAYQQHGGFSVDREGKDLRALRFSIRTLARTSHPLVIFPEGEVYHLNDLVTPFRDGTFLMASSAVKLSKRPIACVPCALKYHYLDDPTRELEDVASNIEQRLGLPAVQRPLAERAERLLVQTLEMREREFLGSIGEGEVAARRDQLMDIILSRLETHYRIDERQRSIPERVKTIRQHTIENGSVRDSVADRVATHGVLEDVHVAVQLYSYVFGYIAENPTIERIAETIDKLEEDILGVRTASIRGTRRGTVRFGQPVMMDEPLDREGCRRFGQTMQRKVQELLDADPSTTPARTQDYNSQAGSSSRDTSNPISSSMR